MFIYPQVILKNQEANGAFSSLDKVPTFLLFFLGLHCAWFSSILCTLYPLFCIFLLPNTCTASPFSLVKSNGKEHTRRQLMADSPITAKYEILFLSHFTEHLEVLQWQSRFSLRFLALIGVWGSIYVDSPVRKAQVKIPEQNFLKIPSPNPTFSRWQPPLSKFQFHMD